MSVCNYGWDVVSVFFFFKQKTAYEMRISDWSSDVCSSDLPAPQWHLPFGNRRGRVEPDRDGGPELWLCSRRPSRKARHRLVRAGDQGRISLSKGRAAGGDAHHRWWQIVRHADGRAAPDPCL